MIVKDPGVFGERMNIWGNLSIHQIVAPRIHSDKNDVRHIKETMVDQRTLLREQNGRISKAEATLGWLKGIGTIFIATFSTIFAWFFNK